MPEFITENSTIEQKANQVILSGILNGLTYQTLFNQDLDVLETNLKDVKAGQELMIKYDEYVQVDSNRIPRSVDIQSKVNNNSVHINLKYNQIELNKPVDFPFNVPERFSVKD